MAHPTSWRPDDDVKEYLEYLRVELGLSINKLMNRGLKKGLPLLDPRENPTMRYYKALEKKSADGDGHSGIWHYTMTLDKRTVPARACANGCPGHASADEAYAHERARRIEALRFDGKTDTWLTCLVKDCGNPTKSYAHIPGHLQHYPLCSDHLSHSFIDDLIVVGESWES